jgi:hypothetical protein
MACTARHVLAALPIVAGIGLQGKAFADLLSIRSLVLRHYERARLTFLIGLTLVAMGVALAPCSTFLGWGRGRWGRDTGPHALSFARPS